MTNETNDNELTVAIPRATRAGELEQESFVEEVEITKPWWQKISWSKIGLFMVSLFLFILALTLMKDGARGLAPIVQIDSHSMARPIPWDLAGSSLILS